MPLSYAGSLPWRRLSLVLRFWGLVVAGAFSAFCQVQVSAKMEKLKYLVGEPVFVVVDVKNVGTEPVGYSYCDSRVDLAVERGQKRNRPILGNCFGPYSGSGGGCGIDHPPLMKPGQTVSFRHLLKDYRLSAGEYVLHASGKAGVRWKYYHYHLRPGDPPPPPPQHRETDLVEGAMFDVKLPLVVEDGTDEELKARFAPYVADAGGYDADRRGSAREAISEMGPPFLEKTILGFATYGYNPELAVKGLGRVQTPESQADLIQLYDQSADLKLRTLIVRTLAEIGTADEVAFFASLLPGRSNQLEDQMRVHAALGLGKVGGERSVQALENAPPSLNPLVRVAVAIGLGNTRSRSAVPVLIRMYRDPEVQDAVCGALLTMTHYRWCDGSGEVDNTVKRWQRWWDSQGAGLRLYGPAECPPFRATLPSVDGPAVLPVPK